jgi:hypothetical protein
MTTKKGSTKKGKAAPAIPGAIKQASGDLYERELGRREATAARFIAAVKGEGTAEEIASAWADFSALVSRTVSVGQLWTPERVFILAHLLLPVDAELKEDARVLEAFDAAGNSKRLAKLITSPRNGQAPLGMVDRLAAALEVTKGEARMAGGYLDETAQPLEQRSSQD